MLYSFVVLSYCQHYSVVIMGAIASQIAIPTSVYSTDYSSADQRKHQSSASLAFVNSPHKWPVMRKMFPFDDVIMKIMLDIIHPGYLGQVLMSYIIVALYCYFDIVQAFLNCNNEGTVFLQCAQQRPSVSRTSHWFARLQVFFLVDEWQNYVFGATNFFIVLTI